MKLAIIGAAGKQGSGAARLLAGKLEIAEILLVDANSQAVEHLAAEIGPKATSRVGDAGDVEALTDLFLAEPKTDVILNMAGPGYRFAISVMNAALRSGAHYVDIQDDAETLDDIRSLHGPAEAAGITMISGAGLAPGLDNILTRRLVEQLDEVHDVQLDWVANMTPEPSVANWGHRLGLSASEVPVVKGHDLVMVPGGTGETIVQWPAPAGEVTQWLCAHPELLTLHEHLPQIPNLCIRGGYTPVEHDELLDQLRRLGLTGMAPIMVDGANITPVDFISHFATSPQFRQTSTFQEILKREKAIGDHNGLRVQGIGTQSGEVVKITYVFFSHDRNIGIYTTAAATTYSVILGEQMQHGVLFPEQLEPTRILELVRAEGVHISESVESLGGGEPDRPNH